MSSRYQRGDQDPYLQDIILSALLWYTDSDYPFGIFKTLYCLLFFDIRIMIMSWRYKGVIRIRISKKNRQHNVWRYQRGNQNPYIICSSSIYGSWSPLWYLEDIVMSVLLRYMDSDHPVVSSRHCVVCSSSNYGWYQRGNQNPHIKEEQTI
jgi:hypothetical protein